MRFRELLPPLGRQRFRRRIPLKEVQGRGRDQVLEHLQGPRVIFLQCRLQLVEHSSLIPNQPLVVPSQQPELLGLLRTGLQWTQVKVVSAEKLRQHPGIEGIALAPLIRNRSRARSNALGLIG